LFVSLAPRRAGAETPTPASREQARQLAAQGFEALQRRDYAVAEDLFRRADELVHAPTLELDHARSLVGLGKFVEGHEQYEQVIREGVAPTAPWQWKEAVVFAQAELASVNRRMAWLTIKVHGGKAPPVQIDGKGVPGAALGVPNRADELARATQKQIDDAMAKAVQAKDKTRVVFLYLRGNSTQLILGEGSRGDVMIKAASAIDVGVEAGIKGTKPITPEALAAARPDVILVLSAGLQSVGGIDGLLKIPGVAQTPAGQNRRVIDLDDQYLLGLGPRTGLAVMDLVKKLHPELS